MSRTYYELFIKFGALASLTGCTNGTLNWSVTGQYKLSITGLDAPVSLSVGEKLTPFQVKVLNLSRALVTAGTYTVALNSYVDSNCTVPFEVRTQGGSNSALVTEKGIVTIDPGAFTTAGTFYILASATASDGSTSPTPVCSSAPIIVKPGAADHVGVVNNLPINANVSGSVTFHAKFLDSYGNATTPPSPVISPTFTILAGPSGSVTSGSPDSEGNIPVTFSAGSFSGVFAIRAQAPPLADGKFQIVVTPAAGSVDHFSVTGFPLKVLQDDPFPILIEAMDSNNNRVLDYTGTIQIEAMSSGSSAFSTSPTPITFRNTDFGRVSTILSLHHPMSNISISAYDVDHNTVHGEHTPLTEVQASECSSSNTLTLSGNWSDISSWSLGSVPVTPQGVVLNDASLSLVLNSAASIGCYQQDAGTLTDLGYTLTLMGPSFSLGGASANFSPLIPITMKGSGNPQHMVFDSATGATLNGVFAGVSGYPSLLSIRTTGSDGVRQMVKITGGLTISTNSIVYIDDLVVVETLLNLPPSTTLQVNPGGVLYALQGITVTGGNLVVNGRGTVLIGNGRSLTMSSGTGTMTFRGSPNSGPATVGVIDAATMTPTGSFSFAINGGSFQANYFEFFGMDSNGLVFEWGTAPSLQNGRFSRIPSGSTALKLPNSLASPWMLNVDFSLASWSPTFDSSKLLDASLLGTPLSMNRNQVYSFLPCSSCRLPDIKDVVTPASSASFFIWDH